MDSSIRNCVFVGRESNATPILRLTGSGGGDCVLNLDGYLIAPLDKAFWVPETTSKWRKRVLGVLFGWAHRIAGKS